MSHPLRSFEGVDERETEMAGHTAGATATARPLAGPHGRPVPSGEPDLWPRRRFVVVPAPEALSEGPHDDAAPPQPTRSTGADARRLTAVARRRQGFVAAVLVAAIGVVAGVVSPDGAAEPASPTAAPAAPSAVAEPAHDTVTLEPGATLWDIAATHAPAGTDPRSYLAELRHLNGFDGADVPAWTVVLLPDVRRVD